MPVVTIQLLKGANRDQKAEIVRDITESLVRVLGKNPENTHVVFHEVEPESWGQGGLLVEARRGRRTIELG
ncbi:MAG: 4-oxalocrotonate tautomerase family protein [Proteobacteria bacterium]|nr:4-oxalocrotonate tautomerase family protein [Pseudomonadota bacterium]